MKFSISINQKSAIDSWLPLDVVDLIIIDYSKWWILSRKSEKIISDGKEYTWVDYWSLIKELPILWITSNDSIGRRFAKLVKSEIFEKYYDQKTSRAFFRFGINYDMLEWDGGGTYWKSEGYVSEVGGGTYWKSEGYVSEVGGGTYWKSDHIIYPLSNIVLDNEEEKKDKKEVELVEKSKFPLLAEKLVEFIAYRKKIKHPIKDASFPAFIRKLEKYSGWDETTAVDILETSIANGYQGIFEPKNKPTNGNFNSSFSKKVWVARA